MFAAIFKRKPRITFLTKDLDPPFSDHVFWKYYHDYKMQKHLTRDTLENEIIRKEMKLQETKEDCESYLKKIAAMKRVLLEKQQ